MLFTIYLPILFPRALGSDTSTWLSVGWKLQQRSTTQPVCEGGQIVVKVRTNGVMPKYQLLTSITVGGLKMDISNNLCCHRSIQMAVPDCEA